MKYKIIYIILLLLITSCGISRNQPSNVNNHIARFNFENASLCPISMDVLEARSNEVYRYVCTRMNTSFTKTLRVIFKTHSEGVTPRGMADFNSSEITIFITDKANQDYILGILAHETGHILCNSRMGLSIYPQLNEGFATWLAGDYWLSWHKISSFSKGMNPTVNNNQYLSVENHFSYQKLIIKDVSRRDEIYNEWASFIDYLIKIYGLEKFKKLFLATSYQEIFKVESYEEFHKHPEMKTLQKIDYNSLLTDFFTSVYGKSFETLKKEWILHISN